MEQWKPFLAKSDGRDIEVPAKPTGIWTPVLDYIPEGTKRLRLTAEGTWKYALDRSCGPDGDPHGLLESKNCLMPEAPVGKKFRYDAATGKVSVVDK